VRALARRLKLHPNTVSAAYKELKATGHVHMHRGSGVYVKPGSPSAPQEARGLDEMIRLALYLAFRSGFSGVEIRAAVERWLAAAPPDRVIVVDPSHEMGELLVEEIRLTLGIPASSCALEKLQADTSIAAGGLALCLPYHLEAVARYAPGAAVEPITLEVSPEDRKAIVALPTGAIVLVVSHSPTVLPFASVFIQSLRGDDLLVETRTVDALRDWKRLIPAADLVFADVLSRDAVQKARPRKLRELRFIPQASLDRLRDALTVVVPRGAKSPAAAERRRSGR
jgi:GntR family transcriptional regulator